MVIAFLLAQLVLSGLPSSPIRPPGMICASGSCERGPMVYRTSASRSRLVVACDMRSDTCSDGRKITTVRATPVPCETSPGVWEMVPENTGCYSVRGLEVWAANTSYLSYGAELDHALWTGQATATKVGANYLVCGETFGAFRQRLAQEEGGVLRAAACRVRASTSNNIRLLAADVTSGGVSYDYTITSEWQTVTATATVREGGGVAGVRLHPATAGAGCINVAGCWSVRGDTPGRACWGGEAPVTCAADRHTISTEGWPTESGEISFTVYLTNSGSQQYLLDPRESGNEPWSTVRVTASGALSFTSGGSTITSNPLSWNGLASVTIGRRGGLVYIRRNGVTVAEGPMPPMEWGNRSVLGAGRLTNFHLNGSIRSLTVRSYEEVSP